MARTVLVTGGAGFIGSHVVERLLRRGDYVLCLDNFDDFYSAATKQRNIASLMHERNFRLALTDIRNPDTLYQVFSGEDIRVVIHLAARPGVRPSIENPTLYEAVNVLGTLNMLEASRVFKVEKFIFASSSSVYGANRAVPFREDDRIDYALSPYAASKGAGELFCRVCHHLYGIPMTVLRFFTVYGPRQRPDMAIDRFTRAIDSGEEISLFGDGTSRRDYTYINDIVNGIEATLTYPSQDFEVFNLGSGQAVELQHLISILENALGKKARIKKLPPQLGEISVSLADISRARALLGYQPRVWIDDGISMFVQWYRQGLATKTSSIGR